MLKNIEEFDQLLQKNRLEYFPEYTDHGREHLQAVLESINDIIDDKAFLQITPEDIYVLVNSVLLHDIAMHFEYENIKSLIEKASYSNDLYKFKAEPSWAELWENHKSYIERLDDNDKVKLLGIAPIESFPSLDMNNLTMSQRIIVGDFIRRYHARIALVIAEFGWPTLTDNFLGNFGNADGAILDLNKMSGYVARSHHMGLRDAADKLRNKRGDKGEARRHRNVHFTYVMGLLRIADLIQFDKKRTPRAIFKSTSFMSPISLDEWKKHISIVHVDYEKSDDPECIFVECSPIDAKSIEGIRSLLRYFQSELDQFWAVTGEYYFGREGFKNLGIKYRRVESNIDSNDDESLQDLNYLPELYGINMNASSLAKLLVEPLYGSDPRAGLRELLQNSIDAVKERARLEGCEDYKVKLEIDNLKNKIVILDEGVGMNPEIIKEYFLRIGSSFRWSDAWKKDFIESSNATVCRGGRFGIGVLASFLLGNKVEVQTRHHTEDIGYSFSFELKDTEISIFKIYKEDPGTKITISNSCVIEEITDFESYKYNYPDVEYRILKKDGSEVFDLPVTYNKELEGWGKVSCGQLEVFYKINKFEKEFYVYNGFSVDQVNIKDKLEVPTILNDFKCIYSLIVNDPGNELDINISRTVLDLSRHSINQLVKKQILIDFKKIVESNLSAGKYLDFESFYKGMSGYRCDRYGPIKSYFPFVNLNNEWIPLEEDLLKGTDNILINYSDNFHELIRSEVNKNPKRVGYLFGACGISLPGISQSVPEGKNLALSLVETAKGVLYIGESVRLSPDVMKHIGDDYEYTPAVEGCYIFKDKTLLDSLKQLVNSFDTTVKKSICLNLCTNKIARSISIKNSFYEPDCV